MWLFIKPRYWGTMVEEATRKQEVSSSSPIRNWSLIVQVDALIFCKINAIFNAKICKIYAKFNAKYVGSALNSTPNMYDQRQLALTSRKIHCNFLSYFCVECVEFLSWNSTHSTQIYVRKFRWIFRFVNANCRWSYIILA